MMPDKVQAINIPTSLNTLLESPRPAESIVAWQFERSKTLAINWRAFRLRTLALAEKLQAFDTMRWSLVCQDGVEFAIGLLALAQAGKTIVLPQNPQQRSSNCDNLLSDITTDGLNPTLKTTIVNANEPENPDLPSAFNESKLELYTSGSSGQQKCIPKTWQQLNNEINTLEATFGRQVTQTVILGTVPHYHIYGLLFRILWPLVTGRPFISQPCLLADEISAVSRNFPSVTLISSPAHLNRLPASPWLGSYAQRIKVIFSSGGPLPVETAGILQQTTEQTPIEIYGSTETGGIAWRKQTKVAMPWQPLTNVTTTIKDSRLSVRSDWTENRDWMDTGDCAQAVDNNQFVLMGRADGVIKIEDKRISLTALETLLLEHPFIAVARLLVLKRSRQIIAAVIVLNQTGKKELERHGKKTLRTAFRKHLAKKYEAITLPRRWRFVDTLPVNAMGKYDWQNLAELFNEEET